MARRSEGIPTGDTAADQRRWEGEEETRHLLPDALGRLSRLLQVIVTHPQLSAEAHHISICMDLDQLKLTPLHKYFASFFSNISKTSPRKLCELVRRLLKSLLLSYLIQLTVVFCDHPSTCIIYRYWYTLTRYKTSLQYLNDIQKTVLHNHFCGKVSIDYW